MTAPISNGPTTTRLHHYAGHYCRGFVLGEFCPGWVHRGRLLGEFDTGSIRRGFVWGEFCPGGGPVCGTKFSLLGLLVD